MSDQIGTEHDDNTPTQVPGMLIGLSARLLVLTVAFVMLTELLIWTPSIAQYRKQFLEERVARAHLAMIAVGNLDRADINPALEDELLFHTDTYGIVLNLTDQRMLMVGENMPPSVDVTINLGEGGFFGWIGDAFMTISSDTNRVLRVIGRAPKDSSVSIEVIMDEQPLRLAMIEYSKRILALSVVISAITALLVYVSLQMLMVMPILKIAKSLYRFRADPESHHGSIEATERTDEIGLAQRELVSMQEQIRLALRQKSRLATLGEAVAKINHDLRNSLATAVLAFDRLAEIDDPEVQRLSPRLYRAIMRASHLCSQTLEYASTNDIQITPGRFHLSELIAELAAELRDQQMESASTGDAEPRVPMVLENKVAFEISIDGDRHQLFRLFLNLVLNADSAGARKMIVTCSIDAEGCAVIDLSDDGPGIPSHIRSNLFKPFSTGKSGGTGLGLVIARDIARAHQGDIDLHTTSADGTTFRVRLPHAIYEDLMSEAS